MGKYLGKGGIVTEVDNMIWKIIDMYDNMLNQEGEASYKIDCLENEVHVEFMESCSMGCCSPEQVGFFSIDEAMFENPEREIKKLFEIEVKEKRRKQWREAQERQRDKHKEETLYKKLKKKYEKK